MGWVLLRETCLVSKASRFWVGGIVGVSVLFTGFLTAPLSRAAGSPAARATSSRAKPSRASHPVPVGACRIVDDSVEVFSDLFDGSCCFGGERECHEGSSPGCWWQYRTVTGDGCGREKRGTPGWGFPSSRSSGKSWFNRHTSHGPRFDPKRL